MSLYMNKNETKRNHKESASIYISTYQQVLKLKSEKKQLKFLKAMFEYEFDGTEIPEELLNDGMIELIWMSAKPLIDSRIKNYLNGRKGGAPEGNKNASKKGKTTQKQPKNNRQTTQKQPKDKEKGKEKDNDNVNYPSPTEPTLDGGSLSKVLEEDNYYDDDYDPAEWEVDENGNWLWTQEIEEGDADV